MSNNIEDYVNLNLDQNDMATPINNLQNNQMMNNIIEQMENIPQNNNLPRQMQQQYNQQPQPQQQFNQQPQQQYNQQQMHQQIHTQIIEPSIPLKQFDPEHNSEDNKIVLSETIDKNIIKPIVETKTPSKFSIKEFVLIFILYIMFEFGFLHYDEYFSEIVSPYVLICVKTLLFLILYSIIKYFLI